MNRRLFLLIAIILVLAITSSLDAQYRIILRGPTVVESTRFDFDQFQVRSAEGKIYTWDQIGSGTVGKDQQAAFDRLRKEVGLPLFRAKHRLKIGDYRSLKTIANQLDAQYASEKATARNCRSKFISALVTLYYHLESANREQAVIPFFELSQLVNSFPQLQSEKTPANLTFEEIKQCQASHLVPIWFDQQNASQVLQQIISPNGDELRDFSDGKLIYTTSLALAAKVPARAHCLSELSKRSSTIVQEWLPLILAYREILDSESGQYVDELRNNLGELTDTRRAAALFLLGSNSNALDKRHDDGILILLRVPAEFGQTMPHLSAASLFGAAELARRAGKKTESNLFTKELRNSYPNSYHARLLQPK